VVRPQVASLGASLTIGSRSRLFLFVLAITLIACGGDKSAPPPTATPSPAPTATPDPGPPDVERERIIEHVRVLAEEIGPRLAGSAEEQAAIDYARAQLESYGYEVEVPSFSATGDLLRDVSVTPEGGAAVRGVMFMQSAQGTATGPLVDAGPGTAGEYANASGAIVLVQRGETRFADMAARSLAAGAVALVVANSEPGPFQVRLMNQAGIPIVAIGQEEGAALRERLAAGPVQVTVSVGAAPQVTSHNVIARTPGSPCTTLTGGHIDSVWWAPGADDNASGSAVVLELARAASVAGLRGHCFALWGGEEEGLLGSAAFVAEMTPDDRAALRAYLNLDVLGSNATPRAIGDQSLLDRVSAIARALGLALEPSTDQSQVGSDHRSFARGGFPVVMLTVPGKIHTPSDTLANLDPAFAEPLGRLGLALLRELEGP
jgi:aminopeptidase YwaD